LYCIDGHSILYCIELIDKSTSIEYDVESEIVVGKVTGELDIQVTGIVQQRMRTTAQIVAGIFREIERVLSKVTVDQTVITIERRIDEKSI